MLAICLLNYFASLVVLHSPGDLDCDLDLWPPEVTFYGLKTRKWLLLHQPQSKRSRVTLCSKTTVGATLYYKFYFASMSPGQLSSPQFDWPPLHAVSQPSHFAAWSQFWPLPASSPARAGTCWCYVAGQGQQLLWQALCLAALVGPHQCSLWGWYRAAPALWTAARRWGSWGHQSASWAGSVSEGQTWKGKVNVKRFLSVTAHFVGHN